MSEKKEGNFKCPYCNTNVKVLYNVSKYNNKYAWACEKCKNDLFECSDF